MYPNYNCILICYLFPSFSHPVPCVFIAPRRYHYLTCNIESAEAVDRSSYGIVLIENSCWAKTSVCAIRLILMGPAQDLVHVPCTQEITSYVISAHALLHVASFPYSYFFGVRGYYNAFHISCIYKLAYPRSHPYDRSTPSHARLISTP